MTDTNKLFSPPPASRIAATGGMVRRGLVLLRRVDSMVWGLLLILLVGLFAVQRRSDLQAMIHVLRHAKTSWTILVLAVAAGLHVTFAMTQRAIFRALGHRIPPTVATATYVERQTVSTIVPLGQAPSFVILLQRFGRYGVEEHDAVFAVVLYSIVGHASFAVVLLPVLAWLAFAGMITRGILLAAIAMLVVALSVAILVSRILRHCETDASLLHRLERRLPDRVITYLATARSHRLTVRRMLPAFSLALLADASGIACLYLALRAVGIDHAAGAAFGGYAIGTLFLLIAPVFQGIGVVELSMTLMLQHLGAPAPQALGATLIYRLGETWLPVVAGVALQARHQKRLLHLPARLPAIWTGLSGALAILSVMPTPMHRAIHHVRGRAHPLPRAGFFDLHSASRSLTLVVGFLLILLSYGLWRRHRTAWWAAIAFTFLIVVAHVGNAHARVIVGAAAINLLLLFAYGSRFKVRADRPTMRRGLLFFSGSLVIALGYGVLSLWMIDRSQFGEDFSFVEAIGQAFQLYFGLGSGELVPHTVYARWLVHSFHLIGWLTVLIAAFCLIRPYVWRHRTRPIERESARALITAHGNSSLDRFKYEDDKQFFFSSAGDGVVAYGLSGRVALALGDPVARDRDAFARTLAEFLEFADANGWHPAFHQTTDAYRQDYREAGLIALKIGAEAIVEIEGFSLAGKRMKALRAVANRYEREGYRAVFHAPPIGHDLLERLRLVSDEWLTIGGRRERGFTLGQFEDAYIQHSTVVTVEAPDGRIEAFVNLIPSGVSGELTFDLMRHRVHAPNGAMDFILLSLIDEGRCRGFRRLSLGMVPFADVGTGSDAALRERALGLLTERFQRYFASQSLWAYKNKFDPLWEPRYLVYPGDAWLPAIGLAIARLTEEPDPPTPRAPIVPLDTEFAT